MDSTNLTLLTAEGLLRLTFRPVLNSQQYDQLHAIINQTSLRTKRDFREAVGLMAAEWGVAFETADVKRGSIV